MIHANDPVVRISAAAPQGAESGTAPNGWGLLVGAILLLVVCAVGGAVLVLSPLQSPGSETLDWGPSDHRSAQPLRSPLSNNDTLGRKPMTTRYAAVYELTGTGRAHVVYTITRDGAIAQQKWVTLPWRAMVHLDADVGEVILQASSENAPPDGFGCRLVVGAETVTDTTPNQQDTVTCQLQPRPDNRLAASADPRDAL